MYLIKSYQDFFMDCWDSLETCFSQKFNRSCFFHCIMASLPDECLLVFLIHHVRAVANMLCTIEQVLLAAGEQVGHGNIIL